MKKGERGISWQEVMSNPKAKNQSLETCISQPDVCFHYKFLRIMQVNKEDNTQG